MLCYNKGFFPLGLFPKLWTYKISPRQVDCVVNKTHRRSNLLTTLTTADRRVVAGSTQFITRRLTLTSLL